MSSINLDSEDTDSLVILFPTTKNFCNCVPKGDAKDGTKQCDKARIDTLAMPTIRHLIASGIFAIQSHNKRHLKNLEKLLCIRLNEGAVDKDSPAEGFKDRIEEFIAKNRPRTPVDPCTFSTDEIDQPIFFDTYEKRSSIIILKSRVYNFRGVPQPIPPQVLNYRPTKRIVELAKPRRPRRLFKQLSFLQRALCCKSIKSMSDSYISINGNISQTSSTKSNKYKLNTTKSNGIPNRTKKSLHFA